MVETYADWNTEKYSDWKTWGPGDAGKKTDTQDVWRCSGSQRNIFLHVCHWKNVMVVIYTQKKNQTVKMATEYIQTGTFDMERL